jgi:CRISPR-associated protein Csx16
VAHAIATFLGAHEILVFATTEAWEKHGEPLTKALEDSDLPRPRHVEIGSGETPKDLWKQFKELLDALEGEHSVAFDITHGFRAQPFFASAVIQFFQSIHTDCSSLNVYYGAFEARNAQENTTPIWDLTAFVELLRWSRALLLFLRTGHADDIAQPTERLGRELQKQWAMGGQQGERPSLAALGQALQEFGSDFVTLRTGSLIARKPSSSQRLLDALERASSEVTTYLPPLASVLQQVINRVKPLAGSPRLSDSPGQKALQALGETYLSLGRYAEAAAILREGWITRYACSQADCPGTENFSDAHRKATEESWFTQNENEAKTLADLRNDIEHAGFRRYPRSPQTIKTQLERLIRQWRRLDEAPPHLCPVTTHDQRTSMGVVYYSIGVERPITPDVPLPPLPEIPRGSLVVIEGRAPIWRYGMAFHQLHGSPAGAIGVYDPRLGAVVVASHCQDWENGQIVDVAPPQDTADL